MTFYNPDSAKRDQERLKHEQWVSGTRSGKGCTQHFNLSLDPANKWLLETDAPGTVYHIVQNGAYRTLPAGYEVSGLELNA